MSELHSLWCMECGINKLRFVSDADAAGVTQHNTYRPQNYISDQAYMLWKLGTHVSLLQRTNRHVDEMEETQDKTQRV